MDRKWLDRIKAVILSWKGKKGQGSLEYIMMLSAVSIVIVIALTMVVQLKGAATHSFGFDTGNGVITQLANALANISTR